ncbi:hypothetical protein Hanom_Chr15g01338481 [Helianthus anomalus]
MPNKNNMSASFNILNQSGLEWTVEKYQIPASLNLVLPEKDTAIYPFTPEI